MQAQQAGQGHGTTWAKPAWWGTDGSPTPLAPAGAGDVPGPTHDIVDLTSPGCPPSPVCPPACPPAVKGPSKFAQNLAKAGKFALVAVPLALAGLCFANNLPNNGIAILIVTGSWTFTHMMDKAAAARRQR